MLLHRRRDYVNIRLQARARNAFGISVTGAPIYGEVLWTDLQNLAIVLKANAGREFDRVPQIIGLDLALATELIKAAAVDAAHTSADTDHRGFWRSLRPQFGFL